MILRRAKALLEIAMASPEQRKCHACSKLVADEVDRRMYRPLPGLCWGHEDPADQADQDDK